MPDLVERLRSAPDISHARILAPAERVPEVVLAAATRDEAAARIEELEAALRECEAIFADVGMDDACIMVDAALTSTSKGLSTGPERGSDNG